MRDDVHAFHRHCIHMMNLIRSRRLNDFEMNFIEGSIEAVKAETETLLRGGRTKADVQLEAHNDGLPCGYPDCRTCNLYLLDGINPPGWVT